MSSSSSSSSSSPPVLGPIIVSSFTVFCALLLLLLVDDLNLRNNPPALLFFFSTVGAFVADSHTANASTQLSSSATYRSAATRDERRLVYSSTDDVGEVIEELLLNITFYRCLVVGFSAEEKSWEK
jgi:hypothetical protein